VVVVVVDQRYETFDHPDDAVHRHQKAANPIHPVQPVECGGVP
jgi:hypothetical protein